MSMGDAVEPAGPSPAGPVGPAAGGAAQSNRHNVTGLRVFPRYLAPASREEIARRAAQIAWVAGKHFAAFPPKQARKRDLKELAPEAFARPLRQTFEELGTTFMKFGQL